VTTSKLGPIWLQPGVTARNALTFFYAAFFTIGMISFMSFMQPYVINENLKIPADAQGGAFVVVGMINLCVCAVAIMVRQKVGYRSPRGE
jgi:uncharacterized membrane protein